MKWTESILARWQVGLWYGYNIFYLLVLIESIFCLKQNLCFQENTPLLHLILKDVDKYISSTYKTLNLIRAYKS